MGPHKIVSPLPDRGYNAELVPESLHGPTAHTRPAIQNPPPDIPEKDGGKGRETTFSCPFCNPSPEYIVLSNDLCYARWDINPVSRGHLLIMPFRHVSDFFDTTAEERYAIMNLAASSRIVIQDRFHPSGYNFGVNSGKAAGQVIEHVHFHLIPRYYGDARTKPNGMRNVIPKVPLRQHKLREYLYSAENG